MAYDEKEDEAKWNSLVHARTEPWGLTSPKNSVYFGQVTFNSNWTEMIQL